MLLESVVPTGRGANGKPLKPPVLLPCRGSLYPIFGDLTVGFILTVSQ